MAARDTYTMNDMFAWEPISAPSSIFPARPELRPQVSPVAPPHELEGLIPFGCELERTVPSDRA